MAKCKICSGPVEAGPAMHSDCLEQLVTEVTERFCDNYCRWPLTDAARLEEACKSCPMDRMMGLTKPRTSAENNV